LKAALVCPRFHPTPGGAERYTYNLALRLPSLGWEVAVLTSDGHYRGRNPVRIKGFTVHYVPPMHLLEYTLPRPSSLRILRALNPHIVHVSGPHPYSDAFALAAKALGIPRVMTHHAPLKPKSVVKQLLARVERAAFKWLYDWVIVTSALNRRRLESAFPAGRIRVIPLGVDETFRDASVDREEARRAIRVDGDVKVLLFVGRLDRPHYYKGLDLLLEAMKFLSSDAILLVVGDGELKPHYQELARAHGVDGRVRFAGFVPDEELAAYYAASDLLVLPSTSESEGFGLVLLEAMSMGTPVMTTEKPGSAELLRRYDAAFILESLNPKEIAHRISAVLEDEDERRRVVRNAKRLVERFNWERAALETSKLYEDVLQRGRGPRL